ncbi:hypothetical protein [Sulfurisphaera ohwakuensis]|uniref:Dihydroxyacetone kinase-like predicted kinase n=1 Tax=Sulfurisphaera ohwakuensis TaxID=69656 RepID=A0A650CEK4_SULOH|nr:hypothetical protein [Sulfurisphaera ohwakuensis]MBB5252776.1 dihydroxyacetone kinase-like predicted kinase [Sulfurisphaera ohwakuensis]QGR16283.1 hypothetical protein D1869_03010 [Sulfurisphaera ohwakuensis]
MLKYVEYTRHSMAEPLATINIYKKVEDGKIISTFKILVYKNMSITVFETDKLEGGQIIEMTSEKIESIIKIINKYYDEKTDDLTILGEERVVDEIIDKLKT